ncbi:hypothetical protein PT974_12513 [Cladobotryum mycophilum]|uniref:Uncharacterized protein n=1 Tax=Cladobotryum mycophilum TaxID=491253 RepID=A0ABR0S859_9HYPO
MKYTPVLAATFAAIAVAKPIDLPNGYPGYPGYPPSGTPLPPYVSPLNGKPDHEVDSCANCGHTCKEYADGPIHTSCLVVYCGVTCILG